jgi:hypothetical protein
MAVVVQCFHCNAVLELDDAFRGGVCRCSSCGSLLQVPKGEQESPAGRKVRPANPGVAPRKSGGRPGSGGSASGSDAGSSGALGQSVNSPSDAGSSSSGLRRVQKTQPVGALAGTGKSPRPGRAGRERVRNPGEGEEAISPSSSTLPVTPEIQQLKRSAPLLWIALALIVVIAAVVTVSVAVFVYRGG